jgi:hypothetical protein
MSRLSSYEGEESPVPEPLDADSPRLPDHPVERGAVAFGDQFVTEWSLPPVEEPDESSARVAALPVDPAPSSTAYLGVE